MELEPKLQMAPMTRSLSELPYGDDIAASLMPSLQQSRERVIAEAKGKTVVADAIRSSVMTGNKNNAKMVGEWNRAAGLIE